MTDVFLVLIMTTSVYNVFILYYKCVLLLLLSLLLLLNAPSEGSPQQIIITILLQYFKDRSQIFQFVEVYNNDRFTLCPDHASEGDSEPVCTVSAT